MDLVSMIMNLPVVNRFFISTGLGNMNEEVKPLSVSSYDSNSNDSSDDEFARYAAGCETNGFMPGNSSLD